MASTHRSQAWLRRGAPALAVGLALATLGWWRGGDLPPLPAASAMPPAAPAAEVATGDLTATLAPAAAIDEAATEAGRNRATAGGAPDPFAALRTGYRGRVVARDGTPVPHMRVRLFRGAPDMLLPAGLDLFQREPAAPELEAARAVSGTDGRFRLDGTLPRGLCWIRLEWPDVDAAPPRHRAGDRTIVPVQAAPAPGEVKDLGDLRLKAGAELRGRIVDSDGRPIAGAAVRAAILPPLPPLVPAIERLSPDSAVFVTIAGRRGAFLLPAWCRHAYESLPIAATGSAPDGTFTLWGVDAGTATVTVTASGHASLLRQGVTVAAATTTQLGDLVLGEGATATIEVRDGAGKPIADAEVLVAAESVGLPVHLGERVGTTDAEGRVTATGLPRGRALAAARRSPRDPWTLGEPGAADGTLQVVLPDRCTLRLAVVDAAGAPAQQVRLQLVAGEPQANAFELAMFGAAPAIDLTRRVHAEDDGRLRIDDLDRGWWQLAVTARDCGVTALQLELQGDAERTVQLRAARALTVRVVDAEGTPVENAAIHVQARGARPERLVDLPLPQGTTDAQGRCRVRDLPTTESRVTASHPRHGQVHARVQGTPPELELRFLAAGSIRGHLTDGGTVPAPGRWLVVLEHRYDTERPRGALPDLPQLTLPGLDGAFSFAALQPGNYRVTVQDSATDVATIGGAYQYLARRKQIFPWNKADVELRGGEQLTVHIDAMLDRTPYDGPGAAVRGSLTIDGAPGDGALVVATSLPNGERTTARVDRGGAFDLGHRPAGNLRLVVVPREVAESRLQENLFSHQYSRSLEVADGAPQQLAIDIITGSMHGEVRDWNGRPVAGCRLMLHAPGRPGESSALRTARTDAAGAFALLQLPIGRYQLRAEREDFGRATRTDVEVTAGGSTGPLAITLRATARVVGRIDFGRLPPGPRAITLLPLGPGEPVAGRCEPDGRFELRMVAFGRYRATMQATADSTATMATDLGVVTIDTAAVELSLTPR